MARWEKFILVVVFAVVGLVVNPPPAAAPDLAKCANFPPSIFFGTTSVPNIFRVWSGSLLLCSETVPFVFSKTVHKHTQGGSGSGVHGCVGCAGAGAVSTESLFVADLPVCIVATSSGWAVGGTLPGPKVSGTGNSPLCCIGLCQASQPLALPDPAET